MATRPAVAPLPSLPKSVSKDTIPNRPFEAGRLKKFVQKWEEITSDPFILDMVCGADIPIDEFSDLNSENLSYLKNQVQGNLWTKMDSEIEKLLSLGVIEKSVHQEDEIISPVFMVPKPDGSYRLILNLKKFNDSVQYEHFKMDNLTSATQMMIRGCYMASVDLRHAYYSVPIKAECRKYLKFMWRNKLYQYTCFPNGLSNCPRYFTKLMKPVYATLRSQGYLSTSFIDDSYLQGNSFEECAENVSKTVKLLDSLGFIIHTEKSVLKPCKKLRYLGFLLNSEDMTVTLPLERKQKVVLACSELKRKKRVTIRELAQVIGQLVATFPAVQWGPLFYRSLDRLKSTSLKFSAGNFESLTSLTDKTTEELDWWIENLDSSFFPIEKTNPEVEIQTDAASSGGWGAVCGQIKTGGRWSETEMNLHINVLEMMAILYALKSFKEMITGKHVKVLTDNTCAVSYISNMGGSRSPDCNNVAKQIWMWCKENGIWISISHIPGILNTEADVLSRQFNDRTEWKLNHDIFCKLKDRLLKPDIDLFASRLNFQMKPFVSWIPDPEALAIDAFTQDWSKWLIYAFPPFSLLQKVLNKWQRDRAEGILIVPKWPTAVWYPQMLKMLTQEPVLLPKGKLTIHLPHTQDVHPLHRTLQLLACCLSGNPSKQEEFKVRLSKLSGHRGDLQPDSSMPPTSADGASFVCSASVIPFVRL